MEHEPANWATFAPLPEPADRAMARRAFVSVHGELIAPPERHATNDAPSEVETAPNWARRSE